MRSGFVTLVGRPNVGKSSLLNAICGRKVSIVSDKPQTTRRRVRGIDTTDETQVVFVDTPGLHKAASALGEAVNATALDALREVDVVCLVLDATQPFGDGDRWVARHLDPARTVVVVNKCDAVRREVVLAQLAAAAELDAAAYFPVSAKTGEGVGELLTHLRSLMPEGPLLYPPDSVEDVGRGEWIAELVREELLGMTRDEVPYSIATRVAEESADEVSVEIVVERDSQKGIVIGKNGGVLSAVRRSVVRQMPRGVRLRLLVVVDPDWQRRPERVERLGY